MIGSTAAAHPHILSHSIDYDEELKRLRRERLGLKVVASSEEQPAEAEPEQQQIRKGFQRFVDYIADSRSLKQSTFSTQNPTSAQLTRRALRSYKKTRDFEGDAFTTGLQLNTRV